MKNAYVVLVRIVHYIFPNGGSNCERARVFCRDLAGSSEAYFSTISSPARRIIQDVVEIRADVVSATSSEEWRNLTLQDRERLLDERLIDASLAAAPPKAQKYHTLGSRGGARNKNKSQVQQTQVRLSTFGVDQVFPRLKINTGQKRTVVDDVISNGTTGSSHQSDDLADSVVSSKNCTFNDILPLLDILFVGL